MARNNNSQTLHLPLASSEGIRKQVAKFPGEEGLQKQGQVRIPRGNQELVLQLVESLGMEAPPTLKTPVLLTVRTQKGTEVQLVWNDPYAFWYRHQRDENAQKLLAFLIPQESEEPAYLEVVSVEKLSGTAVGFDGPQGVDLTDCPI